MKFKVPQDWVIKETKGVESGEGTVNIIVTASDPKADQNGKKATFTSTEIQLRD